MTTNNDLIDITSRAMLVILRVHHWGGSRKDNEAGEVLAVSMGSDEGSADVIKHIVPKEYKKAINVAESRLRKIFYTMTLPWDDGGGRVLPVEMYGEFTTKITDAKMDWETEVDDFVTKLPEIYRDVPARFGKMYRPEDLPDALAVRDMFRIDYKVRPMPNGNDFRISMSKTMMDAIRKDCDDNLKETAKGATIECFARVRKVIGTMIDGLDRHGVVKPGAKKAQFFTSSTLENVVSLVDVLDALNLSGDPGLTSVTSDMRTKLTIWTPDMLKDDPQLRETVAADAKAILTRVETAETAIGGFFGVTAKPEPVNDLEGINFAQ